MKHKPWSDADNSLLKAMQADGASAVRVAAALKRSIKSIAARARMLGAPFPKKRRKRFETPSNLWLHHTPQKILDQDEHGRN